MTDKCPLPAKALHYIVKKHRKNSNYAVAFIITVPVVVFLEVIEIRVADRKQGPGSFRRSHDLGFDRAGARQPRRWMDAKVAVRSGQHRLESSDRLLSSSDSLIASSAPASNAAVIVLHPSPAKDECRNHAQYTNLS